MIYAIGAVFGYLIGSINPAIILSKIKGKDIRTLGSGNAGATNTLRNYGKSAALCVTLFDVLKCVIAILLAFFVAKGYNIGEEQVIFVKIAAAAGCVLGHNYPLYFGFKGGKGVLVSITAVFMLDWRVGLIAIGIFILVFLAWRYVSLGSICGAVAVIISSCILDKPPVYIFCICAGVLTIIRHNTNLGRLLKGTESKTSFKSKER